MTTHNAFQKTVEYYLSAIKGSRQRGRGGLINEKCKLWTRHLHNITDNDLPSLPKLQIICSRYNSHFQSTYFPSKCPHILNYMTTWVLVSFGDMFILFTPIITKSWFIVSVVIQFPASKAHKLTGKKPACQITQIMYF